MKKAPVSTGVGAFREAVRRKSVGLSFTSMSLFGRIGSGSTADDEESMNAASNVQRAASSTSLNASTASTDEVENGDDSDTPRGGEQRWNRSNSDTIQDAEGRDPSPIPVYIEPPEPPSLPPGGLFEAATKNVQGKMKDLLETYHEVTTSLDDSQIQCSVFLSRSALFSDRLVVFMGDSDGSPAGVWSARLCVRSGHGGGGIFTGSLGSMLPYITKAKEDKMGVVMFDDVFHDSVVDGQIDWSCALKRFITGWRNHVLTSRATHVFVVTYRDGGKLFVEALRSHMNEMQRIISGVSFIQSTHRITTNDTYQLRKMLAQWCIAYISSNETYLTRIKSREHDIGCVCLSAGTESSDTDVLAGVADSVYASFKARWSGFRVKNVNSGLERSCYLCKNTFNLRRWRRHCRTCQSPCCEKCSALEQTRHEGQVRLCLTCRALPSLVHWSRPRAVRTGEKESVFSGSAKPGKMSVNDFEMVTVIGRGACGKVLMVLKKDGPDAGRLYAMKVLKKDWVMDKDLVQQTMAERQILQDANHPYIVQLRFAFQNQDKLYMVMDYYSGGSLRQVLRRRGRFSIKRARVYLAQILLAIAHLHASNILYRDLKLENIVISADGNVACTDFGLSKQEMTDHERTSSFVGTCEYLAPELILKEGYGKPVDWWAFGILSYEMIQGDSPFRHNVPHLLFEKILKEDPPFSDRFTPESRDLINGLLTKNPAQRLGCGPDGVEEIKRHPFFEEIDWEGLLNKTVEVPRPPHRMEDVTDESQLSRAIAKMREAREEMMPDSPVSLPSSPSEQKHFDRFSYQGLDGWHPSMANEDTNDFKQDTIEEDEEYVEKTMSSTPDEESSPMDDTAQYVDEAGDGEDVPLSPISLVKEQSLAGTPLPPLKTSSETPRPPPQSPGTLTKSFQTAPSVPRSPGTPTLSFQTTPPPPQSPSTPIPSFQEAPSVPQSPGTPTLSFQTPPAPRSPGTPTPDSPTSPAPDSPTSSPPGSPGTPQFEEEDDGETTPDAKSHYF